MNSDIEVIFKLRGGGRGGWELRQRFLQEGARGDGQKMCFSCNFADIILQLLQK